MRIVVFSLIDDWDIGPLLTQSGHEVVAWVRPAWHTEKMRSAFVGRIANLAKIVLARNAPSGVGAARYDAGAWLSEHKIPTITCPNPNAPEFLDALRQMRVDLLVVAVYPHIFKAPLLGLAQFGVINYHPSLLPHYAGPQPGFWMLRNGERRVGITVHRMTERIDAGDILMQEAIAVDPRANLGLLMQRFHHRAAPLIARTVDAIGSGSVSAQLQNVTDRTYFGKKRPSDLVIDWRESSTALLNLLSAVRPYDALTTTLRGRTFKIFEAQPTNSRHGGGQPGDVMEVLSGRLVVQTGDGCLEVTLYEVAPFHGWMNWLMQRFVLTTGDRFDPILPSSPAPPVPSDSHR